MGGLRVDSVRLDAARAGVLLLAGVVFALIGELVTLVAVVTTGAGTGSPWGAVRTTLGVEFHQHRRVLTWTVVGAVGFWLLERRHVTRFTATEDRLRRVFWGLIGVAYVGTALAVLAVVVTLGLLA